MTDEEAHEPVDAADLNYVTTSEDLGLLNYVRHPAWRHGPLAGLAVFAAQTLRAALAEPQRPKTVAKSPAVLAPVSSLNQLRAVEPVLALVPGSETLRMHPSLGRPAFPPLNAYLRSLPAVPRTVRAARRATGYRRLAYSRFLERFVLAHGLVPEATRYLSAGQPRLVLLANDHSLLNRSFLYAARGLGIPTAYLQHSSVTEGFPPLAFDLAFLDGLDAARKYDLPESRGAVFLTGMAKSDAARRRATHREVVSAVGLALNPLDRVEAVVTFAKRFSALAPDLDLIVRPHPSDQRDWRGLLPPHGYSDPWREDAFGFLDRVGALVCGPSGIALEAALVDVLPLTVDFDGRGKDHYGFVASGLAKKVQTADEALELIRTRSASSMAAVLRYYTATVGTSYDGRSAELIAELIGEHLAGGVDMSRWRETAGLEHVTAYELAES